MARKKVILFIVEGITEKESLELLLTDLVKNDSKVIFEVVGGDVTSNRYKSTQKVMNKITDIIKDGGKRKFRPKDYREIIHLVDMDGAFISEKNIYKNADLNRFVYTDKGIYAKSIESVLERNNRKQEVLNILTSLNSVFENVPYRVFYFSCNLEHVLHNEREVENRYKVKLSEDFQDRYIDDLDAFIDLICNSDFSVKGNYKESWNFIKKDNNSIKRFTNFNILIEDYMKN